MKMTRMGRVALGLSVVCGMGASASAALLAAADLRVLGSVSAGGGNVYSYEITLSNTGTTTVGTMWYAWIPGQNYMTSSPTSIVSPAGWQALVTGGGASNGFAIQWKATTGASNLAMGALLAGFKFDSLDTPAMLAGNSAFFPAVPVATTFVYGGAPFSDPGYRFLMTSVVPEAGSLATVAGVCGAGLLARRRRVTMSAGNSVSA